MISVNGCFLLEKPFSTLQAWNSFTVNISVFLKSPLSLYLCLHQESDSLPPSLAAFSPIDPGLVVYTGYGVERELSFYSLAKKRVIKKIALSHWAMCFSLSSKGRLIAVGSKGACHFSSTSLISVLQCDCCVLCCKNHFFFFASKE